ncbi:MAG TPA: DUF4330 domain-containing protein [Clostridiaceae bacterium]|nr:DUF4330 domain-containing protein [Clostridiaceae bacterium]
MILDKKGKLFGKVSIIDIAIIIVVIMGLVIVWPKVFRKDTGTSFVAKMDKLKIVFYQSEVQNFAVEAAKIGDIVTDKILNSTFGKVVDIETGESVSWVRTKTGEQAKVSKEGYSSVFITVEGTGVYGNNGVKIGNGEYFIGQTITLHVGKAAFYATIYDIKKI